MRKLIWRFLGIDAMLKKIIVCILKNKYEEILDMPFLKIDGNGMENQIEILPGTNNMDVEIFDGGVNFNMDIDNIQELTNKDL